MTIVAKACRAWTGFWSAPESPMNIAAARTIFACHAIWILLSRDLSAPSALPAVFWSGVADSARWRFLIFEGHAGLEAGLQGLALFALIGAVLGIRPRPCCLIAGLLLYHLAPLQSIIWTTSPYVRGLTISVLGLITLGLAGRNDGWALKLTQLYLCQIYLFAGVSKLIRVGPSWVSTANIRDWFLLYAQQDQLAVFRAPGLWLADRPALCGLIALGALMFDLGFIIVMFSKRSRCVVLPMAVIGHLGILFSLNIVFLNLPQLLVFVDWTRLQRQRDSTTIRTAGRTLPRCDPSASASRQSSRYRPSRRR